MIFEAFRLFAFMVLSTLVGIGLLCAIKGVINPKLDEQKAWGRGHLEGEVDVRFGIPFAIVGLFIWMYDVDVSGIVSWTILCGFLGLSMEVCFTASTHPWRGYCSAGYLPFYFFAGPVIAGYSDILLFPVNDWVDLLVRFLQWGIIFHSMEFLAMLFWKTVLGVSHSELGYLQKSDAILKGMVRWKFFPGWAMIGFVFEGAFRLLQSTGPFP